MIHANLAIPLASDSQPSLPPVVIDLKGRLASPLTVQIEEETAQSSPSDPRQVCERQLSGWGLPLTPSTRAEKGKANVGPPTEAGTIAPPVAKTPLLDDFTLEDDPDVIELDDDILDRYLAITAARVPAKKLGKGPGSHRVATPKPPPPRPLPIRKAPKGLG